MFSLCLAQTCVKPLVEAGSEAVLAAPALVLRALQRAATRPTRFNPWSIDFTIFYYFLLTLHTTECRFPVSFSRESYAETWAGVADEEALALE
jgi:hypothetical protein